MGTYSSSRDEKTAFFGSKPRLLVGIFRSKEKTMKRYYIAGLAALCLLGACNDQEIFEKEMYKNVAALISGQEHNTFQEVVHLTGDQVTGYIAASIGGTHTAGEDIILRLQEADEPLAEYNHANFDEDVALYAKSLPRDRYQIEDYNIQIKAGERTGRTKILLNADGLSPDSTYFLGLEVVDIQGGELNPDKSTILYQVLIENDYASQASTDYYSMTGTVDAAVTAANKRLFPLTRNAVRMVAGNETFESTPEEIDRTSVILEVNEDNSVTIKPYKDIQINQLNNDSRYPNQFYQETVFGRTFNVFLLSYAYTINGVTKVMKEELRMQITQ